YNGIFRIPPGFYLALKKGKQQLVRPKLVRYYSMPFSRHPIEDVDKKIIEYEEAWKSSIKDFLRSKGTKKLGSMLSGGLDTSYVVWAASQVYKKSVKTYTCYYDNPLFDEINQARYVAKRCNAANTGIKVDEKDLDLLPEMIYAAGEPVLASSLSIFKLMKLASQEVDTIFTGDGGNNIYHHLYPVSEIHRCLKDVPLFVRKAIYALVSGSASMTGNERLWELKHALYPFRYRLYDDFYLHLVCYRHFSEDERKKLFLPMFPQSISETALAANMKISKASFDDDLISARFVHGNMEYVSTFHERFARYLGMSVFTPYQSREVMEFIDSLPRDFLYKGNTIQKLTNKAYKMNFHKLALKKHFPSDFIDRTGKPFDQPFHTWLAARPDVTSALLSSLKRRGWYDAAYLETMFAEHRRQYQSDRIFCQLSNHSYRIMALLSLEIWCRLFIDKIEWKGMGLADVL
ncbi:MAG: hypothetical protein HGA85_04170, partial [Nanoarchaeota archaeon]|nr:hypothetical protein [Nanoarchaeota archaeon]